VDVLPQHFSPTLQILHLWSHIPANVDVLPQQFSPTLQILHLRSHYTGKRCHAFLTGHSYTINRLWLHFAGKHGHTSPIDQSYTIKPVCLATLCQPTWPYSPNNSVLRHTSSYVATLCRQTWLYIPHRYVAPQELCCVQLVV
jgi:hypothetical protein